MISTPLSVVTCDTCGKIDIINQCCSADSIVSTIEDRQWDVVSYNVENGKIVASKVYCPKCKENARAKSKTIKVTTTARA